MSPSDSLTADHSSERASAPRAESERIRRGDTGLRAGLTLLMVIIWSILRPVLFATTAFSILWTLVTEQAPPRRLRELANRLVAYSYRIGRYITYNEARVPFPFSDFPEALEPPASLGRDEVPEVRELLGRKHDREEGLEDDDDDDDRV